LQEKNLVAVTAYLSPAEVAILKKIVRLNNSKHGSVLRYAFQKTFGSSELYRREMMEHHLAEARRWRDLCEKGKGLAQQQLQEGQQ